MRAKLPKWRQIRWSRTTLNCPKSLIHREKALAWTACYRQQHPVRPTTSRRLAKRIQDFKSNALLATRSAGMALELRGAWQFSRRSMQLS